MSTYLEHLSRSRHVGEVLNDVHRQVSWVVDALDAFPTTNSIQGDRTGLLRDFPLAVAVDRSAGPGFYGMRTRTAHISAADNGKRHKLLTVVGGISREPYNSRDYDHPIRVVGYRGDEEPGDYVLSVQGYQGNIITTLGRAGLQDPELPNEPFGTSNKIPPLTIEKLPEEDYRRLDVVTDGILKGVEAVGLILEGGYAPSVLRLLGRSADYTDRNPQTILLSSNAPRTTGW